MNDIRKERTRELYIDITCDLICKEGLEAVTIRSISEKAGYNSATLYSYFDNLAHLILCAQLRFEERVLTILQEEEKLKAQSKYEVWPHSYAVMAKFYLENPHVFDCGFVADFASSNRNEIRKQREKESNLQRYVMESLRSVAQETGKEMSVILEINDICLAQVTGMVLLYTKARMDTSHPIDIESFECKLKRIIHCFMEE